VSAGQSDGKPSDLFDAFMVSELEHTAESLLRNEEDGERRVTVFLTMAGAAGATLTFLAGGESLEPYEVNPLFIAVLLAVLVVGYVTFVRVVRRNLTSDEYKERLNRARTYFVPNRADPRIQKYLPFDPYEPDARPNPHWLSIGRAGWLETTAVVNALIAGALGATLVPTPTWLRDAMVAALFAGITWFLLIENARRRYRLHHQKLRDRQVNRRPLPRSL
jgi:hypothetical protein